MPTIRLVPSILNNAAGTKYLTVTDESKMFTNTDSTTYGVINNIYASTSSRYVYLRGFNFSSIPDGSTVTAFSVKLKAKESGASTNSSYVPILAHGTTTFSGCTCSAISTSTSTKTFTISNLTWDTLSGYGDDFGIRLNVRRNRSNTAASYTIYGAEIEVTYTAPVTHNVTVSNTSSATITASASTPVEGTNVTITASTITDITIKDNGTDVTSQFVQSGGSYVYTISNIAADHTITATDNVYALWFKSGGAYVAVAKAYKKVSGAWVEQAALQNVFDASKHYIRGEWADYILDSSSNPIQDSSGNNLEVD